MNNPLTQKYQYYLNESHRLSEELKSEQEYSEFLENILLDLLNNEQLDESVLKNIKNKLLPAAAAMGIGIGGGAGIGAVTPEITAIKNATNLMGVQQVAPPREVSTKRGAMVGGGLAAAGLTAAGALSAGYGALDRAALRRAKKNLNKK
jgi:hypothetical protein